MKMCYVLEAREKAILVNEVVKNLAELYFSVQWKTEFVND